MNHVFLTPAKHPHRRAVLCFLFISMAWVLLLTSSASGQSHPISISVRSLFCDDLNAVPKGGILAEPVSASGGGGLRSLNTFQGFRRCPGSDPANPECTNISLWKVVTADAFYRDVIVAAATLIQNATDQESWTVTFTKPDGTQFTIGPVTYSSASNCFTLPGYQVCGTNSIQLYWYFNSQCAPVGQWSVECKNNGTAFDTGQFMMRPRLGTQQEMTSQLPAFAQTAYPSTPYDSACHTIGASTFVACDPTNPTLAPWTIAEQGCSLTALCTMLGYHGVAVEPPVLNQWFIDNRQYIGHTGRWKFRGPVEYAKTRNVDIAWEKEDKGDDGTLFANVCKYGPVVFRVLNDHHSVTATGQDDAQTTFTIIDAYNGHSTTLATAYGNSRAPNIQYVYSGPQREFRDDRSGISFTFHSPVDAFVIDPLGRRAGRDPRTGAVFTEIPGAIYTSVSMVGPAPITADDPPKVLDINRALEGAYALTVVGTAVGTYAADFEAYDVNSTRSGRSVAAVATAPSAVHTYLVEFRKAAGSVLQLAGSFDGGGQRPKDVNRFLTYSAPVTGNTTVAAGVSAYPLVVLYGTNIVANTFIARLNGNDITASFTPVAGGAQSVTLQLQPGRNVLVLSVDGNLPNRVATDTDRLVFDVR